jgi:hypothetical protein
MTKILSALAVVAILATTVAVPTTADAAYRRHHWKKKWVYPWGPYWGHGAVVYRSWGWDGPGWGGPGPWRGGPGWW